MCFRAGGIPNKVYLGGDRCHGPVHFLTSCAINTWRCYFTSFWTSCAIKTRRCYFASFWTSCAIKHQALLFHFVLDKLCNQTSGVAFLRLSFNTSALNRANRNKTKIEPSNIKALWPRGKIEYFTAVECRFEST